MRKLRVKGLPDALPELIELDITKLELGDSIRVSDLSLPGITIMEKPNDVVVSVKMAKKVAETPAETAAAAGAAAPVDADKKAEPAAAAKK